MSKRWLLVVTSHIIYMLQLFIVLLLTDNRLVLLAEGVIFCLLLALGVFVLYLPYKRYKRLIELFNKDYLFEDFFGSNVQISASLEKTFQKFDDMLSRYKILNDSRRYGQYLALQNQINPHFLYNTLEAIRGEAIASGLSNVEKMTETLSAFFRYTISNMENLVTFNDELDNINDYYMIQKYRFQDRIGLTVEIDEQEIEEILDYKMPKLILQPIVENSVYHGIERKKERGSIDIKAYFTDCRFIIKISDNGMGIKEQDLALLNEKLNKSVVRDIEENISQKGGIAIVNVNKRIKLVYGEDYGIVFYSIYRVGTDVVVTLPRTSKEMAE